MPFLSIVTRHLTKRVLPFLRCQKSVLSQTDPDYEHIVLPDPVGIGIAKANQMLFLNKNVVSGDYIFILDDDGWLMETTFVSEMKDIIQEKRFDIVIFKTKIGSEIYPKISNTVIKGEIDAACVVVKSDLWKSNIHLFMPFKGGDYVFIHNLLKRTKNVYWLDKLYSCSDKARFGAIE